MKEIRNLVLVLVSAVFFVGLFIICNRYADDVKKEYASQINPSIITGEASASSAADINSLSVEKQVEAMVTGDYSSEISLMAVGDILCQGNLLEQAYDSSTETFDFSSVFSAISSTFAQGDYVVGTLKTTMAGAYKGNTAEYNGYCSANGCYNSPESLAAAIKAAGVSMVNTATNHTLDSWTDGIATTLTSLDTAGLQHVGTAAAEAADKSYIASVNGINVGFIGYTNTLNGYSVTSGKEYAVNTLSNFDETKVSSLCDEITSMQEKADIVTVMVNFDSSSSASDTVTAFTDRLFEAGADIILGTGPLTVQPMEVKKLTDDSGNSRYGIVIYSLGEFLSTNTYASYSSDADLGAVFDIKISRDGLGEPVITGVSVIPTYMDVNADTTQIIPICQAHDTDTYSDILDEADMSRINSGFESVITTLTGSSGLNYTYENYEYAITMP